MHSQSANYFDAPSPPCSCLVGLYYPPFDCIHSSLLIKFFLKHFKIFFVGGRVNVQKFEFFYFKFEVEPKRKIVFLDSLYTGFEKYMRESLKMKKKS